MTDGSANENGILFQRAGSTESWKILIFFSSLFFSFQGGGVSSLMEEATWGAQRLHQQFDARSHRDEIWEQKRRRHEQSRQPPSEPQYQPPLPPLQPPQPPQPLHPPPEHRPPPREALQRPFSLHKAPEWQWGKPSAPAKPPPPARPPPYATGEYMAPPVPARRPIATGAPAAGIPQLQMPPPKAPPARAPLPFAAVEYSGGPPQRPASQHAVPPQPRAAPYASDLTAGEAESLLPPPKPFTLRSPYGEDVIRVDEPNEGLHAWPREVKHKPTDVVPTRPPPRWLQPEPPTAEQAARPNEEHFAKFMEEQRVSTPKPSLLATPARAPPNPPLPTLAVRHSRHIRFG